MANSQAPSGSPQIINGSSFIASNQDSDFGLVELNSVPPISYDVFYAGWRNTGAVSSTAVCIHHPSGDVKKISFDSKTKNEADRDLDFIKETLKNNVEIDVNTINN